MTTKDAIKTICDVICMMIIIAIIIILFFVVPDKRFSESELRKSINRNSPTQRGWYE